jgi:VRR-NUC domain
VGAVRRSEEQLHRAVVQLLQVYANRGLLAFCHVPNGERRDRATAGRLKAMGTTPGVPDLRVWARSSGFGIELKAGAGKLSPAQLAWHETVSSLGHRVYVCRSVDDVERCLRMESVPPVGTLVGAVDAKARGDADMQEGVR